MYRATGQDDQMIVTTEKAAAPTADQILAFAASSDCTQLMPQDGPGPCLDRNTIPLIASCKFGGGAPPGVSAATWKKYCDKASKCAWDGFPGCMSFDAVFGPAVPACIEPGLQKVINYCDTHPMFDGPDRGMNMVCWAGSKSTTWSYNMHTSPPCGGASASHAEMSPSLKWGLAAAAVVAGAYLFTRRH